MAKLNTAIRGAQIKSAVAGNGLEWTTDDIMGLDLKASAGLKIDTGELSIEPADFAGDGLADDGSDNLKLDLNELTAAVIDVSADEIAIIDATDASTKKESIADIVTAVAGVGLAASAGVLAVDLNELSTEATFDAAADYIGIVDVTDSGSDKTLWSVIATAIAGTGLTATNGVLAADAVSDNVVEDDIQFEDESANCNGSAVAFTLSATPLANSLQVYLNGLLQQSGSGKDYTISGTTVTFATAPASGDILLIHYIVNN